MRGSSIGPRASGNFRGDPTHFLPPPLPTDKRPRSEVCPNGALQQNTEIVSEKPPIRHIRTPQSFPFRSCNTCAKPGAPLKLLLVGGDNLVGWTLRPYVELLSGRSQDWLSYIRVYIVPLGCNCNISKQLAAQDQGYAGLFPSDQELKGDELVNRIHRYLAVPGTAPTAQLPLAEAMLNCQDDLSQLFIPFVNVSLGCRWLERLLKCWVVYGP